MSGFTGLNDQIYLHPSHSILRLALDKIAEIKSLLEERRIGKSGILDCKLVHLHALGQLWKLIDLFSLCSCQDGRSVQWHWPTKKNHAQRCPDDPVTTVSHDPSSLDWQTWREVPIRVSCFISYVLFVLEMWILSQNDCYIYLIHSCLTSSVHRHCVALYQQAVTMWRSRGTRWRHVWRPWMVMNSGFSQKLSATITPPTSNDLPVDLQMIYLYSSVALKTWLCEMIMLSFVRYEVDDIDEEGKE